MRKQEFLHALGDKLKEGMTSAQILSQVRYYEGYIDGEIAKGKTEEEAVEDLGDPILIARNILESPREDDDSVFGTFVQDQEDAYEEGNYQGENQHSEEEVRQAVKEDIPLGDTEDRKSRTQQPETDGQTTRNSDPEAEKKEQQNPENEEDPYNGSIPIHDGDADSAEEENGFGDSGRNSEEKHRKDFGTAETESADQKQSFEEEKEDTEREVKSGTGIFHDEYGKFRWDLLGVILAFAIGLTAVIWLITKIVAVLSPVVIIILLVIIIVFLVIHFRS